MENHYIWEKLKVFPQLCKKTKNKKPKVFLFPRGAYAYAVKTG